MIRDSPKSSPSPQAHWINLVFSTLHWGAAMTSCQRSGQWQQAIGFFKGISVQVCSLMWLASMQSWVPAKNAGSGSRRAECFMTVLSCQFVTHILTLVEAPACTLHALANGGTGFSQQHSSSQTSARPLQLQCSSERLRKGRVMGGGFVPFWRYADRPNSSGRRSIQRSH